MKTTKFATIALCLAAPLMAGAPVWAVEGAKLTTQQVFEHMALAQQAIALNPPKAALLNSPLATHPMFNQVFASIDESKLNAAAAQVTAEQFTTAELKALVAFQSSPEGKSIQAKMPGYQQILGATMQNYLSIAFQQMMTKQGSSGASNIPVDASLGGTPVTSGSLPPMTIPAATPLSTPIAPTGAGTPLKH